MIVITSDILKAEGLTLKDVGVLLYYAGGGLGDIVPSIGEKLWNKNMLIKALDGYEFNPHVTKKFEEWAANSRIPSSNDARFAALADKLRDIYPPGKREGTSFTWRDNTVTIAKKLKTLCDKFGCTFTDEQAIEATQRYVNSFNGNYRYMQLLKYFILKKDNDKMEETSQLLSFIQNEDTINNGNSSYDNGEMI